MEADQLMVATSDGIELRQAVEGFLLKCADRARQLEEQGAGPPAEETMTGRGRARLRDGRATSWAADVTREFPLLGAVIRADGADRESVAALARLWRRLDEGERSRFVAAYDEELAGRIRTTPPDAFIAAVQRRGRAVRVDDGRADQAAEQEANSLVRHRLEGGRFRYVLEVDALTDEQLWPTVERRAWSTLLAHGDVDRRRSVDEGAAGGAMVDLLLAGASAKSTGGRRAASIGIIVDHRTLRDGQVHDATVCETERGTPVPLGVLGRFACDAEVESYHLDGSGRPFDHGRTRRTASHRQRRALRIHYGACPLSGAPFVECEIHHLDFWEDAGPTDYDNLIPISRRWHHLVHDHGWRIVRDPDGGLTVSRPDGEVHRRVPPPVPVSRRSDSGGPLQRAA